SLVDLQDPAALLTRRRKRQTFSEDERRIAGCLLQCVHKKAGAVDVSGFPTREGLVRLYAEGVQERGYYLATAAASQQCLQTAHQRRLRSQPSGAQTCDLAYDIFECISNKIAEQRRSLITTLKLLSETIEVSRFPSVCTDNSLTESYTREGVNMQQEMP
ncbi:hypothetical protein Cfor_01284, partial [Coptotermes formosanus]